MNQNTINGTRRQSTVSRSGKALERGYIYLHAGKWDELYSLAKASGLSASLYIESLIPTVSGTSKVKENNASNTTACIACKRN